jgi:hypothetical protein
MSLFEKWFGNNTADINKEIESVHTLLDNIKTQAINLRILVNINNSVEKIIRMCNETKTSTVSSYVMEIKTLAEKALGNSNEEFIKKSGGSISDLVEKAKNTLNSQK